MRYLFIPFLMSFPFISQAENDPGRYWAIFAFESTCTACVAIANQVNEFSQKTGLEVQAISRDGRPLITWSANWAPDRNGALWRLGVRPEDPTPQVYIMDSKTKKKHLISYGYSDINSMISQYESIRRNEK